MIKITVVCSSEDAFPIRYSRCFRAADTDKALDLLKRVVNAPCHEFNSDTLDYDVWVDRVYLVQEGDTLVKICFDHGTITDLFFNEGSINL